MNGGDTSPANVDLTNNEGIKQKINIQTVARFFNVDANAKACKSSRTVLPGCKGLRDMSGA